MRNLERLLTGRHRPLVVAVLVAGGMAIAWSQRFVLDDAFIAYRYARHAARGMGFVWNVGEPPLEGFTSFAWTLLLTVVTKLGLDPETASTLFGVACFGGTIVTTYALALTMTTRPKSAVLAAALVAVNPTTSAFATSGLETSAQTLLATASLAVVTRALRSNDWKTRRVALAGALAGLAVTVRMDALVLLLVVQGAVAFGGGRRAALISGAAASVFIVPWLGYRMATFGRLLPNTYYAKVAGDSVGLLHGLDYLATFAVTSGLLVAFAVALGSFVRRRDRVAAPSIVFVVVWCLYVAAVGADFMEFRFMSCAIPTMIVLFTWTLRREIGARAPRIAFAAALALAFAFGWRMTRGEDYFRPGLNVESVRAMAKHVDHPDEDWRGVGQALHRAFPTETNVVLALRAAGAIADASALPVVDVFGLNDRWVAEHGTIDPDAAIGHRRVAPVSYLQERSVNLVLGSSGVWRRGEPRKTYSAADARRQFLSSRDAVPANARVIEIPIDEKRAFRCLYLTPHPAVEAKLGDEGWRVFPINR